LRYLLSAFETLQLSVLSCFCHLQRHTQSWDLACCRMLQGTASTLVLMVANNV